MNEEKGHLQKPMCLMQAQDTAVRAPSRSCTLAAVALTVGRSPKVSTTRWRLRPLTFLPAS